MFKKIFSWLTIVIIVASQTPLGSILGTVGNASAAEIYKQPNLVIKSIAATRALYEARRINTQQYVFLAIWEAEMLHQERWISGQYDELASVSKAIEKIEKEYGLKDGEYWPIGTGPVEHQRLNKQYSNILDKRFIELLKELDLNDLAAMKKDNPDELDRLYERGRRSAVHADEYAAALSDIVLRYEMMLSVQRPLRHMQLL